MPVAALPPTKASDALRAIDLQGRRLAEARGTGSGQTPSMKGTTELFVTRVLLNLAKQGSC
jgi:hypothetical protein